MRVKSFIAKLSVDAVHAMDDSIILWLERNNVEPKIVNQTIGEEHGHDGRPSETIILTSIWY